MSKYATSRANPAATSPLAEMHCRRVQRALQTALGASVRINVMERAMTRAVRDAADLMNAEVAERAGERYGRSREREGHRNGTAKGYVVVGGRKVRVARPRLLCTVDGSELPLETYRAMQDPEILNEAALGKVIDGVAQRQAHNAFKRDQPLPAAQEAEAYGDSKSSVSRRWIAATTDSLVAEMNRRLDDRRYLAVLLDGKGFGEHLLVAALGIDEQGHKHVLGLRDGGSEDEAVCSALLQDLMDRGLNVRSGVLVVIDGGKGLAAAVRTLWGDVAIVGRCVEHKKRNVLKHLPKRERAWVKRALWQAWRQPDEEQAERDLRQLISELEPYWPDAANSLREGLMETLACQHLGLPADLVKVLQTTNLIENAFSTTESTCHRVCRWRNAAQAKRWASMALLKAERGFGAVASAEAMAVLAQSIERHQRQRTISLALVS